jgi:thiopeptide-type bacteriocin biosynthesis protein
MNHVNHYRAAYFRTTLLPFKALDESASAVQSAKSGSCDALIALLDRGPVSAALENASPSLCARLQAELAEGSIKPKAASAVLKYLSRMASRCTPFGLMSGVLPAEIAEGSSVDLRVLAPSDWTAFPRISYERTFRAVRQSLRARIERSDDFCVRLSATLELRDGRVNVMSFHYPSGHITPAYDEIAIDQPLTVVLEYSRAWVKMSELARILCEQVADITVSEARDYVLELLECGLLQDTFYPCLDPMNAISPGILEACGHDPRLMQISQAIERASRKLPVGQMSRNILCDIAERAVAELNLDPRPGQAGLDISPAAESKTEPIDGTALQIDTLVRASSSSVGTTLVEEVLQSIARLSRLARPENARLAALKEQFVRKFGEDSVSLLRAVAPDDGLSLNPFMTSRPAFLDVLPIDYGKPNRDGALWSPLDAMMLEKLIEARTDGRSEIALQREDLEPFLEAPAQSSVRSGYVLFSVHRRSTEEAESSPVNLLLIQAASSGVAGSICARFAHLDARLDGAYRACFAAERLDDVVDADILYLPSARLGNVSCRPAALEHQIPIFGYATDDGCKSIDLADLYLSLDQQEGFVLTSRKLGKRVRPVLASAHNFLHPECAPVYQFLALLNHQDSAPPVVDLLPFARQLDEQPAVRLGSLLLTPRCWCINARQMSIHRRAQHPGGSLRAYLEALGVSRFVRFGKNDNLLTCDLESEIYMDLLLEEKELTLQQAIPDGYEPACDGDDGLRQVELALQYVDSTSTSDPPSRRKTVIESQVHLHGIGHWNYIKLYGSPQAIDAWIRPISVVTERLCRAQKITAWHFARYMDPDWHLRVRWRSADAGDHAFLDQILSSLAGCATPTRVSAETFYPETFRYGGTDVIETIHDLFTVDSAFVSTLLGSGHASTPEGRVKLGILSAGALARGLGLDNHEMDSLWEMLASAFVNEFGGKQRSRLRKQLGGLWRNWRSEILDLDGIFTAQMESYAKTLAETLARSDAWGEKMTRSRLDVCADLIHMHSNRLFLDCSRENEMCCYALAFHLNSALKFRKD